MSAREANIQREYWNRLAAAVEDEVAVNHWVDEKDRALDHQMFDEIARFLAARFLTGAGPRNVLEIGCGNSLILDSLDQTLGGTCRVYGIDISEKMLSRGRGKGIATCCAEANRLPYAAETFDLIFLHSVTQYFGTQAYLSEVLIEAARTLKPGGHLCLLDVSVSWYREIMQRHALQVSVFRKLKALWARGLTALKKGFGQAEVGPYTWEKVHLKRVLVPQFRAFYADPDFFYAFGRMFSCITIEVQPFQNKPLVYRRFRFNVLMTGRTATKGAEQINPPEATRNTTGPAGQNP